MQEALLVRRQKLMHDAELQALARRLRLKQTAVRRCTGRKCALLVSILWNIYMFVFLFPRVCLSFVDATRTANLLAAMQRDAMQRIIGGNTSCNCIEFNWPCVRVVTTVAGTILPIPVCTVSQQQRRPRIS